MDTALLPASASTVSSGATLVDLESASGSGIAAPITISISSPTAATGSVDIEDEDNV